MKNLAILVTILSSVFAKGALPPTAESLRRIQAVTQSAEVFNALGSAKWVTSIRDNENGTYTVFAGRCTLQVGVESVESEPPMMVSPLKVTVGQLVCT